MDIFSDYTTFTYYQNCKYISMWIDRLRISGQDEQEINKWKQLLKEHEEKLFKHTRFNFMDLKIEDSK